MRRWFGKSWRTDCLHMCIGRCVVRGATVVFVAAMHAKKERVLAERDKRDQIVQARMAAMGLAVPRTWEP